MFKVRKRSTAFKAILALLCLSEFKSVIGAESEADLLERMQTLNPPSEDAQDFYNAYSTSRTHSRFSLHPSSSTKSKRAIKFETDEKGENKFQTVTTSLNVGPRPGTPDSITPPISQTNPKNGARRDGEEGGEGNMKFIGGPGGYYQGQGQMPPYGGGGGGYYPGGGVGGMGGFGGVGMGLGGESVSAASASAGTSGGIDAGKMGYPFGGGGYFPNGGYNLYPGGGGGGYYGGGYPGFGGGYPQYGQYGGQFGGRPNYGMNGGGLYAGVPVVGYYPVLGVGFGGFRKGEGDSATGDNMSDNLTKSQPANNNANPKGKVTPPPKKVSSGSITFKGSR